MVLVMEMEMVLVMEMEMAMWTNHHNILNYMVLHSRVSTRAIRRFRSGYMQHKEFDNY